MKKKILTVLAAVALIVSAFALTACSSAKAFSKIAVFEAAEVEKVVMTNGVGASKTLTGADDIKAVCDAMAAAEMEKKDEGDVALNEVPYVLTFYFSGKEGSLVIDVNKRIRVEGDLKLKVSEGWWQIKDLAALKTALNAIYYGTIL